MPGATLRLTDQDTQKVWISWTDESGKFEFPSIPPGHYKVEATQIGFQPATFDLQIAGLPAPHVQLVLRVATLAELAASAESSASNPRRNRQGAGSGGQGGGQYRNGPNGNGQGRFGGAGRGGRGQDAPGQNPPGQNALQDAINQSGAGGGFQETDVTTDESAAGQENETAAIGTGGAAGGGVAVPPTLSCCKERSARAWPSTILAGPAVLAIKDLGRRADLAEETLRAAPRLADCQQESPCKVEAVGQEVPEDGEAVAQPSLVAAAAEVAGEAVGAVAEDSAGSKSIAFVSAFTIAMQTRS